VTEQDGLVTLTVRDTGTGLSTPELAQLFARSIAHTRAPLRSGLGLMIAREIVERHHGTVRAESRGENQGTLMTVSLPAATRDA
jgi:two-component system CheB/CheR fusion protein